MIVPPEPANDDGRVAIYPRSRTSGNLALQAEPNAAVYECPIRFQGQWDDEENGLFYNRHRYYDTVSNQYTSPDPIKLFGGNRLQAYVANPNVTFDAIGLSATLPTIPNDVPGRVQSRINITNKGFDHILDRHYGEKNASKFTISQQELKDLLASKVVVRSRIVRKVESEGKGTLYVRQFDAGRQIVFDKFDNFNPTNTLTILTDRFGNLDTTFPGKLR